MRKLIDFIEENVEGAKKMLVKIVGYADPLIYVGEMELVREQMT